MTPSSTSTLGMVRRSSSWASPDQPSGGSSPGWPRPSALASASYRTLGDPREVKDGGEEVEDEVGLQVVALGRREVLDSECDTLNLIVPSPSAPSLSPLGSRVLSQAT